jgi:alkylhydroperoxidase family enzyme
MTQISYENAPVHVRDDIPAAEQRAWDRLARAGTWWTGAERVAIAAETRKARDCALCRERKQALTPNAVDGEHDHLGKLPPAAVDAIHRLVTDSGRLSRSWYEEKLTQGLSDGQYVEIIGVITTVQSIDYFCRGLGVPLHALPEPVAGEPTRYRPATAELEEAFVPMISSDRASGAEADLFGGRRTGNVIRAMSLVPDEVRNMKDLSSQHYLPIEDVGNPTVGRALTRNQIELVAGRVSALNECFY